MASKTKTDPISMRVVKGDKELPDASEFGQIRAHLAKMKAKQADITAILGDTVSGQTRAQVADKLRVWLKNAPKAE